MRKIYNFGLFLEKKAEKEEKDEEKDEKDEEDEEKDEEKSKSKKSDKKSKSKKNVDEDDDEDDDDEDDDDEDDDDEDDDDEDADEKLTTSKGGCVKTEVKKIISETFVDAKNIKFSGDQDGEPEYVDFEIEQSDFKLSYPDDLYIEYSDGIMKKKVYHVSLTFDSKSKEGKENAPKYKIRFEINLKPAALLKYDIDDDIIGWNFEQKPTKVIAFIKAGKQKFDWDDGRHILTMNKDDFDKLDTGELKILIRKEGGIKIKI